MLEWTGERFLPWLKQATIAYEHLHRYAYAATLVKDKRVLDLACGEGYGSKILSETASSVLGIDIDEAVVRHATERYGDQKIRFISGSITAVPIPDDHSFDAIVCFEAIEHINDHEKLLAEVKRLLRAEGIFIVSTPNKTAYHQGLGESNPFHVKELALDEFRRLLCSYFKSVAFLGQRIHPASSMWPIESSNEGEIREFVMERNEAEFRFIGNERRVPIYFIAVASDARIPPSQPASILLDHSDDLIREKNDELEATRKWREDQIASLQEAAKWREEQLVDREKAIASLEEANEWRQGQIDQLRTGLEWVQRRAGEMEETTASQREALAWRANQVQALENENQILGENFRNSQIQLARTTEQLEAIHAGSSWKFILRVRHIRDSLLPQGSARRTIFEKITGITKSRG